MKTKKSNPSTLINIINDCVVIIDCNGRITFMNSKAEYVLGLDREKDIGKNITKKINLINEQNSLNYFKIGVFLVK